MKHLSIIQEMCSVFWNFSRYRSSCHLHCSMLVTGLIIIMITTQNKFDNTGGRLPRIKMASEGTSKNKESFIIRPATSLNDLQWVIKMAAEEGFTPRMKEAECYFIAGLASYFYIAEVSTSAHSLYCILEYFSPCFCLSSFARA